VEPGAFSIYKVPFLLHVHETADNPSTNEKIELVYHVTNTAKGWRISDISGKDWSLLKILLSPE